MRVFRSFQRKATLSILIGAGTITAAGAAGMQRLAVTQGTGSNGATNFLNASVSNSALEGNVGAADTTYTTPFAIFGAYNDTADSTFGIGVLGASTNGYGIAGVSNNNSQPSILAYPGGNGIGLEATTTSSSTSDAIYAESKGLGNAVHGQADGTSGSGGYFLNNGTNPAVYAYAMGSADALDAVTYPPNSGIAYLGEPTGEGVHAFGYSGNATHPALEVESRFNGTDLIGAFSTSGGRVFSLQGTTANRSNGALTGGADLQVSGDLYIYGHVFQDCNVFPAVSSTTCYEVALGTSSSAFAKTAQGDVKMYPAAQTLPTVEDAGSAHMAYGHSLVRIDPRFAATMSHTNAYMVTVTPNGNSHGVFVTNKSPDGFEVIENDGGRSTLDFDYRIVARPLGDTSTRLAAIAPEHKFGETEYHKVVSPKRSLRKAFQAPPISPAFVRSVAAMHVTR